MPRKFDPLSLELDQALALAQAETKAARDAKAAKAAQDARPETPAKTDWDEALRRIEEARESGSNGLDLRRLAIDRIPEALADLTGLQQLDLTNTQITDCSPLAGLTGLLRLYLTYTQITDCSPLAGLTGLHILALNNTQITDSSPLASLTGLQYLFLSNTPITDCSPLAGLTGLQTLDLVNTQITDVSPLAGLTGLRRLILSDTPITDVSPLSGLTGLEVLDLGDTQIKDVSPLANLTGLEVLDLGDTQIKDVSPLANLTGLQALNLRNTPITDVSPLAGLTGLQTLFLTNTNVYDLRPLLNLPLLTDVEWDASTALFLNNAKALSDPAIAAAMAHEDREDQRKALLAHLQSLPPWPEPLPYDPPPDAPRPAMPDAPDPAPIPPLYLGEDDRIDLPASRPTNADHADPIKQRLFDRLAQDVARLDRFANRYPDVAPIARSIRDATAQSFGEVDVLFLHLDLLALEDLRQAQAQQPEAERWDAECSAAVTAVLRTGPGVTIDNPDVSLHEDRASRFARRVVATEAQGERNIAADLGRREDLATDPARDLANRASNTPDEGRSTQIRRDFVQNAVLILSTITGQWKGAAIGAVYGKQVEIAASFILTHASDIMAVAPHWGELGAPWAECIIRHARDIVESAERGNSDSSPS